MEHNFNQYVETFGNANRQALDAALRFNKMMLRMQGLLARQQLAAFESLVAAGSKQLRLVGEIKDPKDLVSKQAEVAVELGEKMMAVAQESFDIQSQAREELTTMVEEGMKAVPGLDAAAEKAPAKTVRKAA